MLSDRIKEARKKRRMTQQELADAIGITKGAVSQFESNFRRPTFENLEAIADALNVNKSFLLEENDMTLDECDLLNCYRMCGEAEKAAILAFAKKVML